MQVWNSNIACRPPCETSGWYGVYGVRNSERERIASTRAGHVVVVHAGAEEADLGIRIGVPGGERAEVLEDVLLGHPVRQIQSPVQADLRRDLLEQLFGRLSTDLGEHRRSIGIGR